MRGACDEPALAELEGFYREVDALYAGSSCPGTTECCRFGRTGREPYVTALEVALVARASARRSGPRPSTPPPLHVSQRELPMVKDERSCPMLTREGRCSIYEARPFGCRTFYCERATHLRAVPHREMLALVRRLKELASRYQPGGDEGRPLTRELAFGTPSAARAAAHRLNKSRARSSKASR